MDNKKKRQVKEPPSVPFLWEVKPGIPKKDWKPEATSIAHTPKTPLKLVASIPFSWEEAPGKCLSSSIHPSGESVFPNPLPSAQCTVNCNQGDSKGDREGRSVYVCQQGCYNDEPDWLSELDCEFYETDDSFRSMPSLLANCVLSTAKISTAPPLQKSLQSEVVSDELEIPNSPTSESGSSTSSYATGCSSPTGAEFLERIFPLIPPRSSFLQKIGNSESMQTPPELKQKDFYQETNSSVILRRPITLGELIMMSRRRSCQRKAVQMRKQNLSMEIETDGRLGCFMFKTGSNMMKALHREKKFLPRLKLA